MIPIQILKFQTDTKTDTNSKSLPVSLEHYNQSSQYMLLFEYILCLHKLYFLWQLLTTLYENACFHLNFCPACKFWFDLIIIMWLRYPCNNVIVIFMGHSVENMNRIFQLNLDKVIRNQFNLLLRVLIKIFFIKWTFIVHNLVIRTLPDNHICYILLKK